MKQVATFNQIRETLQKQDPERFLKLELAGKMIALRNRKALTQDQLSDLSGVPQKTISAMENGKGTSIDTFSKLARAMDCRLRFTLEEEVSEK